MAIPLPGARGGHATAPKAPRIPKPKMMRPQAPAVITPEAAAMTTFRTALAQLKATAPQVNTAAIQAPYDAASAATGQLGQGLQQSLANVGQQAQAQYNTGLGQAQQQAAQFGISAGAGANAAPVQNTGTGYLANQTQAQMAAAPQAAAAWQQLLMRTAAAKIGDAQAQRQNVIDTGSANLATALPGYIQTERDNAFKTKVERFNEGVTKTQLNAKQNQMLNDYSLGAAKVQQSARSAATSASIKRDALKQKAATDAAKLAQGDRKLNQGAQALAIKKRASQATAQGLKGIASVTSALTKSGTTKSGTTKAAKGWDVQAQQTDSSGAPLGPPKQIHVADKRFLPAGWKAIGTATTHYETVPVTSSSAGGGLTAKSWTTYYRSLLAQNPGGDAAIRAFLGPKPKK